MKSVAQKPASRKLALWRLYLVIGLLLSMLSLLVGRVLSLQILDTERGYAFLQDQGEARALRTAEIPAYRGVITDRRGEPLAVSPPVISIWADPRRLGGSERLPELAEALEMKLDVLQYAGLALARWHCQSPLRVHIDVLYSAKHASFPHSPAF